MTQNVGITRSRKTMGNWWNTFWIFLASPWLSYRHWRPKRRRKKKKDQGQKQWRRKSKRLVLSRDWILWVYTGSSSCSIVCIYLCLTCCYLYICRKFSNCQILSLGRPRNPNFFEWKGLQGCREEAGGCPEHWVDEIPEPRRSSGRWTLGESAPSIFWPIWFEFTCQHKKSLESSYHTSKKEPLIYSIIQFKIPRRFKMVSFNEISVSFAPSKECKHQESRGAGYQQSSAGGSTPQRQADPAELGWGKFQGSHL